MIPTKELVIDRALVDAMPWEPFGDAHGVHHKTLWRDAHGRAHAGLLWLEPAAALGEHTHRRATHDVWVVYGTCTLDGREVAARSFTHVPIGASHGVDRAGPEGCVLFYVYQPIESD